MEEERKNSIETQEEKHTENKEKDINSQQAETKDKSRIKELEKELLYLRAEFENYKKRLLKESEQLIKYANEKLIKEILHVEDLLEKAISSSKQPDFIFSKEFIAGIEMIQKVLSETLERFGVKLLGKEGEPFNPELHEAISQVEVLEEENDNKIISVAERGCMLHDRLIRAAKVIVGKKKH